MSEWISVNDSLPEREKPVLVAVKNYRGNMFVTFEFLE